MCDCAYVHVHVCADEVSGTRINIVTERQVSACYAADIR